VASLSGGGEVMARSYNIIDTGVTFKGYPVLLGPRLVDDKAPDKLVLTSLDRFLRREFPYLEFIIAGGETLLVELYHQREVGNASITS
jgi:hypothetical protein